MLNTRLILLDGIPGTGKSTLAQFIFFQLQLQGIKVRWFHEEELWHPLFYFPRNIQQIHYSAELDSFTESWPSQWKSLFNYLSDNRMLVITSYLFEDGARVLFANNCDTGQIKKFVKSIVNIISSLNPVLIFFYTENIYSTMLNMWTSRGCSWMRYFYGVDELTFFARKQKLNGTSASLEFWSQFQDCCRCVIKDLSVNHLCIDVSKGQWPLYYQRIIGFLQLGKRMKTEEVIIKKPENFCGFYLSTKTTEISCRIFYSDDKLFADFFWPDIPLIAVSENRFWLRSFPFQLVFEKNDGDHFTEIHLEGTDLYHLTQRVWKRVG